MTTRRRIQEILKIEGLSVESDKGSQANWLEQLTTLTRRSFINMSRDIGYYRFRIIIYIVVSLCVGNIYFNVGTSYTAILARASCGGFISGFMTFMSIGGFPSFIEEMKVQVELSLVKGKEQGPTIVEESRKQEASLLGLGQKKRSITWRLLMMWVDNRIKGGIVNYCVQNSTCMALAVRKKRT